MKRRLSILALVAVFAAGAAGSTRDAQTAHAAGAHRADLVITRAATASRTITQGGQIAASWVLENRGGRKAPKSTTHVLLAAGQEAEELLSQAEADIAELRQ